MNSVEALSIDTIISNDSSLKLVLRCNASQRGIDAVFSMYFTRWCRFVEKPGSCTKCNWTKVPIFFYY